MRREAQPAPVDVQGRVAVGGDRAPPATLHAVEGQQVRRRRGAAFQFVEMHHVEPVAGPGIVRGALGRAPGCTKGQTSDAAQAVDADSHGEFLVGRKLYF